MPLLNPGDLFPRLTIDTTDGEALTIPDAFAGDFAVILFNRGAWCPYCNAQLRAFERASQTLADNGIRVVALSVDDKETTAALYDELTTFDEFGELSVGRVFLKRAAVAGAGQKYDSDIVDRRQHFDRLRRGHADQLHGHPARHGLGARDDEQPRRTSAFRACHRDIQAVVLGCVGLDSGFQEHAGGVGRGVDADRHLRQRRGS